MVKMSKSILLNTALLLIFGVATDVLGGDPTSDDAQIDAAAESATLEASPDWVLTRDEAGIRSYKMQREGSPLLCFKAEGIIDAPVHLVLSVVLDAERSMEWISYLSESVVLRWVDEPIDYVQLSRFDIPWPVKDRVFISRVAIEVDPETYEAVLVYHPADDQVELRNAVLGSATGTRFHLRPIDGGGRTSFTGIGIADPKGALPKWLVNWVGGSWPHQTIQALRKQVRKHDISVMPALEPLYAGFEVEPRLRIISADPPSPEK